MRTYTWIRSAIHYDIIQDVVRAVGFVGVVIVAFVADELFDETSSFVFVSALLFPHDSGFKAQPQADCNAVLERSCEDIRESTIVEFCEKTEGAQGESKHWGHDSLEEPTCV